jgi:hypothetical protein
MNIKKQQFNGELTEEKAEERLQEVQDMLDKNVYRLYGIEEIKNH